MGKRKAVKKHTGKVDGKEKGSEEVQAEKEDGKGIIF